MIQAASQNKLPKHVIAEKELLRVIEAGEFPPGSQLPGIRDLATRLNIAPMTLRHAIGRLADQGILERRQRVGTFVREGRIFGNIGILFFHVRRINTSNLPLMTLQVLATAAEGKKRRVHAMLMTPPLPSATQVYEELRALNVGVVALQGFLDEDRDFITGIASHIPCVLFNKGITGVNLPCATPDGFAAARLVVDYLKKRHRKRIACGRFVTGHRLHQEFLMTMESELLRQGFECNPHLWFQADGYDYSEKESQAWIDALLASPTRIDGLVLGTKGMVSYAIERMAAMGETPGKERDIVVLYGGYAPPTPKPHYATVAYNDQASVEASTKILMDILEGRVESNSTPLVRIPPQFILPEP